jgi:hypothetical protein
VVGRAVERVGPGALVAANEFIRPPPLSSHAHDKQGFALLVQSNSSCRWQQRRRESAVRAAGFDIEAQSTWDKSREFEEWMGIVNDPERVAPLRVIAAALARAGEQAGMGLSLSDAKIVFFYLWHMITARKP